MSIDFNKEHLLVISPHADDETLMAGGLLQQVGFATIVHMSVGNTIHGIGAREEKLLQLNKSVQELGWSLRYLPFSDQNGELYEKCGLRCGVAWLDAILKAIRPTVVVLPMPSAHQDHRYTFDAGLAALRVKEYNPWLVLLGECPSNVTNPYEQSSRSAMYVGMTIDQMHKKERALAMQELQISSSKLTNPSVVEPWARFRGLECGQEYAEKYEILRMWA
jgi:LmbE family N-acetylglucosaminyl deacetylase